MKREDWTRVTVILQLNDRLRLLVEESKLASVARTDSDVPATIREVAVGAEAPQALIPVAGRREPALQDQVDAAVVLGPLGDDVDDTQHRLGPIEHRARAQDDLDAINQLERDRCTALEVRRAIPRLVHAVPVDQQQYMVSVVDGQGHSAGAHLHGVQWLRGGHPQRQEIEGFVQAADPVAPQLVGGDRGRRGGRRVGALAAHRRGLDDGFIQQGLDVVVLSRCMSSKGEQQEAHESR